jgi:hypothetical protein
MRVLKLISRAANFHDHAALYVVAKSGGPSGTQIAQFELDLQLVRLFRLDKNGESIDGRPYSEISFLDQVQLNEEQWTRLCQKYQQHKWPVIEDSPHDLWKALQEAQQIKAATH